MRKILVNKIRCKKCGDIIESKSVHDFNFCKCESVAVDGGHDYLRRVELHKKVDILDKNQLTGNLELTEEILKDGIMIYG